MAGCSCGGERPRCEWCVQNTYAQLAGVAESRGEGWACGIAYACASLLDRPWPDDASEKLRAIASRKVADLAHPVLDPALHARLVERALRGARRAWERLRADPERARLMRPSRTKRH